MGLSPGTRIGVYEITAPVGAGGMGEVYRARDTRLKRDVAIKVLPDTFAHDPERLARFQREAEFLATLNHPNIAAIYGLEDAPAALVMEFVEGETLADRIARGPIPLDEALPIARQIVDALEAAHDRGVVHRDLKPANIKLTPDGKVKVLDFGLAKALESPAAASAMSMSPTLSLQATYAGVILGTAAYMSPEQARGKAVDRRTDIWAFGCVLYEMLTGRQALAASGDTVSDAVASVLLKEPDWSALPADTPPHIQTLLRRCLQKDLQKRVPHIGVARLEIDEAPQAPVATPSSDARQPRWRRMMPAAAVVIAAAALTSIAWWLARPRVGVPTVTRFTIPLPEGQNFTNTGRQLIAISPDGTQVVYVANGQLHLRSMSTLTAAPIDGTAAQAGLTNPVFSPDGRSIVYWSGDTGGGQAALRRISVNGGAPVTLTAANNPFGMSWSGDWILYGQQTQGVMRVPATGGVPDVLVPVPPESAAHGPQLLPGGDAVLFTVATGADTDRWDKARIVVHSLKTGESTTVIEPGSDARFVPPDHIVYAQAGVVYGMRFDAEQLRTIGGPVPVIEGVRRAGATGTAQFATAENGALVYLPGPLASGAGERVLGLVDRDGQIEHLKLPAGSYSTPRISPDGGRVAYTTESDSGTAVWTYELSGARAPLRVTFGGNNRFPLWSPDGRRLLFQSDREGDAALYWQPADGTGTAERVTKVEKGVTHVPEAWSSVDDGFLYSESSGGNASLWFFSLKARKAEPVGAIKDQRSPTAVLSPDGRWLAYQGPNAAVYVQPFPTTGALYQVAIPAGIGYRHPLWTPDGRELVFVTAGAGVRMWAIPVSTTPTFAFGNPVSIAGPWADGPGDVVRQWDITLDGKRFIARLNPATAEAPGQGTPNLTTPQIQVVLNWFEELRQRVPVN